ncbi:ATP-dependent nuclease [Chlorobaculum tepidum]|nr:ATP-binding protein [Chlorobaculum tepidum]
MITRLTLRNFKNVQEQTYEFTEFDLLVGRNNSGKSTVLQAIAIWQYCIDEFHRSNRSGTKGIQIVLPNFTALPVPEFNLLWRNKTDREYPFEEGKKKQKFILIQIIVEWKVSANKREEFGIDLRYQSPQTIYAIPEGGWGRFRELEDILPRIAYVPPFSGLDPMEKWLDIAPIRQQVGKGQPGSVLRNLLYKVKRDEERGDDWGELASIVKKWFSVEICEPVYDKERDVHIKVEYRQNGKEFDIISGGSGFHQTLTLLAFLYGYNPTVILLDEPDAHLHVNLQREILDYFKRKSQEKSIQFLIATHAEEFAKGVDASQIISLMGQEPERIESVPKVIRAMAEVSNEDIVRTLAYPYIVYVEGESDERIIRAWSSACGADEVIDKVCFKAMSGGDKQKMKKFADKHFEALKQIVPKLQRIILLDYDESEDYHPQKDNEVLYEWQRKNIENYLFVPDVWKRVASEKIGLPEGDLFLEPVLRLIDDYFESQNLVLPKKQSWKNVSAEVFKIVDGKKLLFERDDSLFHQLSKLFHQLSKNNPSIQVLREEIALNMKREEIALNMKEEEIHEDVHEFMNKLKSLFNP